MNESVFIFDTYASRPIYHDYGGIMEREGLPADVTVCGLTMYRDGETKYRAHLPDNHAAKFARPCRRCFKEAADA